MLLAAMRPGGGFSDGAADAGRRFASQHLDERRAFLDAALRD
ncbi:MAG: hypothetical protein AB1730_06700 [Myxococcota bacterium]|jgi:hypothetical protein